MKSTKWALILLVILLGCQSVKPVNAPSPTEAQSPVSEGLLFLSLFLEKAEEGLKASIASAKITEGRLKRESLPPVHSIELLVIDFLSADERVLVSRLVENPLRRNVEVSDESGRFERHQLDLDKATLVLRIPYFKGIRKLRISDPEGEVLSIVDLNL